MSTTWQPAIVGPRREDVTAPVADVAATPGVEPEGAAAAAPSRLVSALTITTVVAVLSYLMVTLLLAVTAMVPMLWGWQAHLITSGSMSPAIEPGWVAVAAPHDEFQTLEAPAIVTFTDPERGVMAHRVHDVITTEEGSIGYVTKGDANRSPDGGARRADEIHGNVRMVVPFVGLPALWAHLADWVLLLGWIGMTGFSVVAATTPLPPPARWRS